MKFVIYGVTKGRGDGIGRAVAACLLKRGHEIKGVCRDEGKASAESEFPVESIDLASTTGQQRLKQLICEYDPDAIWSACGSRHGTPLWSMPDAEIDELIDANVRHNIVFCRTCAPSCVDGGPHLILTGSAAGVLEGVGASVYSGVKGFLVPFVRGQRAEYKRQGHQPKISLLSLYSFRSVGAETVADAIEFMARQSWSIEMLVS